MPFKKERSALMKYSSNAYYCLRIFIIVRCRCVHTFYQETLELMSEECFLCLNLLTGALNLIWFFWYQSSTFQPTNQRIFVKKVSHRSILDTMDHRSRTKKKKDPSRLWFQTDSTNAQCMHWKKSPCGSVHWNVMKWSALRAQSGVPKASGPCPADVINGMASKQPRTNTDLELSSHRARKKAYNLAWSLLISPWLGKWLRKAKIKFD